MVIKAVVFDIGGVIVGSPLVSIVGYSKRLGLPNQYLNVIISGRGAGGVWQQFERGEIDLETFLDGWNKELNDWTWATKVWDKYLLRNPDAGSLPSIQPTVDSRELFNLILGATTTVDPVMIYLLKALRRLPPSKKVQIIALTNNFFLPKENKSLDLAVLQNNYVRSEMLSKLFDFMVESWKLGMRKPEQRIYEHTQKQLGVEGSEIAFLDDIGGNLKGAQKLNWNVIRVYPQRSKEVVTQLEQLLGVEKGALSGSSKI